MGETGCDIWEKMGSLELHEKNKNSFLTSGGNGVRHMGEKGSLELHEKNKNSFLTYGGNGVRHMGEKGFSRASALGIGSSRLVCCAKSVSSF